MGAGHSTGPSAALTDAKIVVARMAVMNEPRKGLRFLRIEPAGFGVPVRGSRLPSTCPTVLLSVVAVMGYRPHLRPRLATAGRDALAGSIEARTVRSGGGADDALEPAGEVGLGREPADVGDVCEREPAFGDERLCALDAAVRDVAVWRRAGRRLEGAGEMERAEVNLVRECIDGQVFADMGVDEFHDPFQTPRIERAAHRRQRGRRRFQVGVVAHDVDAEGPGQGLDLHPAKGRFVHHLGMDFACDVLDQGVAKAAVVAQANLVGVDVELPKRRFRQRRRRKVEVDALLDIAVEVDHVLADAGRAQPDGAGDRVVVLEPAVAAPADAETALKHHDDLGVARLDLCEVAFRVLPALRKQPSPPPAFTCPEPGPGCVLRSSMSGQPVHAVPPPRVT